ncbi:hypothetical protein KPATCC21470_8286 [Kitasatospora purpeofusca]
MRELRGPGRACEARCGEQAVGVVEQYPPPALQLDLELGPLVDLRRGPAHCPVRPRGQARPRPGRVGGISSEVEGLGRHPVFADLRQDLAPPVEQLCADPVGAQMGHRRQSGTAGKGREPAGELGGHLARASCTERKVHFMPHIGAQRQLDVPAGVPAAGPATHRDPTPQKTQIRGVVVEGVEVLRLSFPGGCHAGQLPQARRQREPLVLAFHFAVFPGHTSAHSRAGPGHTRIRRPPGAPCGRGTHRRPGTTGLRSWFSRPG